MFEARKPRDADPEANGDGHSDSADRSAREEIEKILEGLAHDLKNALSSIVMNTALARRIIPGAGSQKAEPLSEKDQCVLQMIERIQFAADRIGIVMQDTLDISKCVTGNLAVVPAKRQANILIRDVVAEVETECAEKGTKIETRLSRNDLTVAADRDKVPKALQRLVSYGVKVSPVTSVIELSVDESGGDVNFRLALPSEAIAPERQDRIFEREGKKSGLSLVRGIIEVFGGRTWARTCPDGRVELGFSLKNANDDCA